MKKLIVANWKELPATLGEAEGLLEKIDGFLRERPDVAERVDLVICPPMKFLERVAGIIQENSSARLGAQDVGTELGALGVRYIIVGHSDRRYKLGESDAVVNEKLKLVLGDGMVPIVCIGERTHDGEWQREVEEQVRATFADVPMSDIERCIIAYEPVWAISTNPGAHPDTPDSAAESAQRIRELIGTAPRMLYGGSIIAANAKDFLSRPEFSGVMIGGASVRADEFCRILTTAKE